MTRLQRSKQSSLHLGTTREGESITLTGQTFPFLWISGISGSGKSTLIAWLVLSLLRMGYTVVGLDPHGDLVRLIVSCLGATDFYPRGFDQLHFIDFNRQDSSIPFNVLRQEHTDNYTVAQDILQSIHRAFPTSTGTTPALDNTITYASFVLAENGMPITQLQRFLLDTSFRNSLLAKINDQQIVRFFDYKFSDKVSTQLIDSTMRRLDILTFSPILRRALGQKMNKLSFRNLWEKNISCLISLGGLTDAEKRLAGCLLLVSIEQHFLSRLELPPEKRSKVALIVDEAPLFISQDETSFTNILEQCRKAGAVYTTFANQTLTQLSKGMLGSLQQALPVIFRAGTSDSRELASRFYRPKKEQSFDFFGLKRLPRGAFDDVKNTVEARMIFEQLQRQEAIVMLPERAVKIQTPTIPVKIDQKKLAEIENEYARRLLTPLSQIEREIAASNMVLVSSAPVSSIPTVKRRVHIPASDIKESLTLVTGILDTDIMLSLFHFHYMTIQQIATLIQKENSRNYVRDKIQKFIADGLIDKISLPRSSPGKSPTVYFLTTKGQKRITDTFGLSMPLSAAARKHQFLEHTLSVNDVLLAGVKLPMGEPSLTLVDLMQERTLKTIPVVVAPGRAVIPDGFLAYQTATSEFIGLCLEIDRNTESPEKIQEKVQLYTRAITSGAYTKALGTHSCTIAFCITVGGEHRREQVRVWVKEVVEHSPLQELCLFGAVSDFSPALFTDPVFRGVDNSSHSLIEKSL